MRKLVLLLALCIISSFASSKLYAQGNGINIEKSVKIFKAGAFNLDQDKLVRTLERNVSGWAEYQIEEKNRRMFFDAYGEVIKAINEGRISREYDRYFRDSKGLLQNKENGFDGVGNVLRFVSQVIDHMIEVGDYIE